MLTESFREWMQGFLLILDVFAIAGLAPYILQRIKNEWRTPHLDAAIALLIYISGHTLLRLWLWVWLHLSDRKEVISWMDSYPILGVGTAMTTVGLICCLRVFVGATWSGFAWIWFVMAAGVAAWMLTLLP
jgi:hypothetical protein